MAGKRAVTYSRCSTEEESQKDALQKQIQEAKECVEENKWFLTDTYIEAKSGTSTKGRKEYSRLYDDLLTDKFDIIVIKSQDRLMRNVKDWYMFIDRLVSNHKKLYIYIERKFYSTDDALITGIKAILAEDYSRELSKKINNAHRNRQKHGNSFVITSRTIGYRKTLDKKIEIDEEEAAAVHKMYEYSAMGYGSRSISNILYQEGHLSRSGKRYTEATIRRIIRSRLPMGTVVMNRKHYDFDTKQTIQIPASEHIIIPMAVPAIVEEKLWLKANAEMDKRAEYENKSGQYVKGSNPGKYKLSGKLVCGECGAPYYRSFRKKQKGNSICDWRCSTYIAFGRKSKERGRAQLQKVKNIDKGGCDNIHLEESKLFQLLEQVCIKYYKNHDKDYAGIIEKTIEILRKVLSQDDAAKKLEQIVSNLEQIRKQRDVILEKLLEGIISNDDYLRKIGQLDRKSTDLQKTKNELEIKQRESEDIEERISMIREKLKTEGMQKVSVYEMIEDIERIIVYQEHLLVQFSSSRPLGLDGKNKIPDTSLSGGLIQSEMFQVEVSLIDYFRNDLVLEKIRDDIVAALKDNPELTGRMIAGQWRISLSTANKRLEELKKEGRIRFIGTGGHGHWEVIEKNKSKISQDR